MPRAYYAKPSFIGGTTLLRYGDRQIAAEVLTSDGFLVHANLIGCTHRNDVPASDARARAKVHHQVSTEHSLLIVLHHYYCIAPIPELFQRL